jgi:hypothetical protein
MSLEESLKEQRAADPLRDFFVLWDEVDARDVQRLRETLARAKVEADMQSLLAEHPEMLIQHLGGGHGRWVLPQKRLGAEHVPDFMIGDRYSGGRDWVAVELEGPTAAHVQPGRRPVALPLARHSADRRLARLAGVQPRLRGQRSVRGWSRPRGHQLDGSRADNHWTSP